MAARRTALVISLGGQLRVFATEWRFVTGLGREHPVENGFAWHHTLGTAYLPGSSVKGLVRAWARKWEDIDPQVIDRIFGPEDGKKRVGSVIFFDALPLFPLQLDIDVMTPHYTEYYRDAKPPGDWMSPDPIQFLTVAEGQEFLFSLAPRSLKDDKKAADVEMALAWLESALAWAGAGAKTTAGYGRLVRREEEEKKLLRKQQEEKEQAEKEHLLLKMSPLRREMEEDCYSTNIQAFMQTMDKWLERMETGNTSLEEKTEIAYLLQEWYEEYYFEQWTKPNNKNKIKIGRIKKTLGG